jgi:hypothetical protein
VETFSPVFGFVAAICIGIITLTVFFTLVGMFNRKVRGFEIVKTKKLFKEGKLVNITLNNGTVFRKVKFVGFTTHHPGAPSRLSQMLVCEKENGSKVFFQADTVRVIEEADETGGPGPIV